MSRRELRESLLVDRGAVPGGIAAGHKRAALGRERLVVFDQRVGHDHGGRRGNANQQRREQRADEGVVDRGCYEAPPLTRS